MFFRSYHLPKCYTLDLWKGISCVTYRYTSTASMQM